RFAVLFGSVSGCPSALPSILMNDFRFSTASIVLNIPLTGGRSFQGSENSLLTYVHLCCWDCSSTTEQIGATRTRDRKHESRLTERQSSSRSSSDQSLF